MSMAQDARRAAPWAPAGMDVRRVYRLMAHARLLEERMIKMTRSSDGFFWIGGPGEEAFNVCLGLMIKKGRGLDYDFLHLHYRSSAILLAMGMPIIDALRQMASKATDPHSGGRNFINHFCVPEWNVVPGVSTIETQYSVAPGTALAQRRHGGDAITIVNGGDAGSAESDFATCLNWSSRPGRELPILIVVANNQWGISTPALEVQGARPIARRAESFGIPWAVVDGHDPVASWKALEKAIGYVRKERKPYCIEAMVSRLYGHSSSSGAVREQEPDCLDLFERRLAEAGVFTKDEMQQIKSDFEQECLNALNQVREEPFPDPSTMFDHTFA